MTTTPVPEIPDADLIALGPSPWEQATRKADAGKTAHIVDDTGEHRYVLMSEEQYLELERLADLAEDAQDIRDAAEARQEPAIPWEQAEAELDALDAQGR